MKRLADFDLTEAIIALLAMSTYLAAYAIYGKVV